MESVHGEAPDANVRFVGAASCEDTDLADAGAFIVNHHLASIVSNSYGEPADHDEQRRRLRPDLPGRRGRGDRLLLLLRRQRLRGPGRGLRFRTDPGRLSRRRARGSPRSAAPAWRSAPTNNYELETSWGTLLDPLADQAAASRGIYTPPGDTPGIFDGSSGGGVSTEYTQPFYQRGVVPYSLATTAARRHDQPDADAGGAGRVGAGRPEHRLPGRPDDPAAEREDLRLLAQQDRRHQRGLPDVRRHRGGRPAGGGHPLGFANPAIYDLEATGSNAAFNDVTDYPFGPVRLAEVRNNYTDPYTKQGRC